MCRRVVIVVAYNVVESDRRDTLESSLYSAVGNALLGGGGIFLLL